MINNLKVSVVIPCYNSEKTIELALKLDLDYATFNLMNIYPGSEDFETWRLKGNIPEDFNWDKPLYTTDGNIDNFQKLLKKAYRKFYIRPAFLLNRFIKILSNPKFELFRHIDAASSLLIKNFI